MALFNGGHRPTKTIQLNDTKGTDKLSIKNANGFEVASIDSKGNIRRKGSDIKTGAN